MNVIEKGSYPPDTAQQGEIPGADGSAQPSGHSLPAGSRQKQGEAAGAGNERRAGRNWPPRSKYRIRSW